MVPASRDAVTPPAPEYLDVQLDGRLVGRVRAGRAAALVAALRQIKAARLLRDGAGDPSATAPPPLQVGSSQHGNVD
jgi:hypothetical protein